MCGCGDKCKAEPGHNPTASTYHKKKCRCLGCTDAAAGRRNKGSRGVRVIPRPDPQVDISWMEDAKCKSVDISIFFPPDDGYAADTRRKVKEAKELCRSCPVRVDCLWTATKTLEAGIWGGTTGREREYILYKARQQKVDISVRTDLTRFIPA